MPTDPAELNCYLLARRPDGSECRIDLIALEDALDGVFPGETLFQPDSGTFIFPTDDLDELDDDEVDNEEALSIDPISSRTRFEWMEEFGVQMRSVPLRAALTRALGGKKPFRAFKDVLIEYPEERENWHQFEAQKLTGEAISFIESLDWEILEVVDTRPKKAPSVKPHPEDSVPITAEEHDWILRGAWQIAARGGRTQLSLLLKGSKNRDLLKHGLDSSPAYGRLSFLTLEEIERRIDRIMQQGVIDIQYSGDLPLVIVTPEGWEEVRPWAHQQEWTLAAAADKRKLGEMFTQWRNRPREEQYRLVDAVACLDPLEGRRLLEAWSAVSGKEMRARIAEKVAALPKVD